MRASSSALLGASWALDRPSLHPTPVQPTDTPASSRTRLVIALLIAGVGVVWVGQGLGLLPGSFMSGDRFWALLGAALVFGAVVYAALPRLRRR
jgi:hypothetical protein